MAAATRNRGQAERREEHAERSNRQYARTVYDRATVTVHDSLFSESHLYNIAEYLNSQPKLQQNRNEARHGPHCVLVDFMRDGKATALASADDLRKTLVAQSNESTPALLLFLQGASAPEWLNVIGEHFDVDVEIFQKHLGLRFNDTISSPYMYPALPSGQVNIPQLKIHTIARLPVPTGRAGKSLNISAAWKMHSDCWAGYMRKLRRIENDEVGPSLLRSSTLHDLETLSVEQAMTIHVKRKPDGWLGLVWTDVGADLADLIDESWFGRSNTDEFYSKITTVPTPLKAQHTRKDNTSQPWKPDLRKMPQSAVHLPRAYASLLDGELARHDAFYAMTGLLDFVAHSTASYLNMLGEQVEAALEKAMLLDEDNVGPRHLLRIQKLLLRTRDDMIQAIDMVQQRNDPTWFSSHERTPEQQDIVHHRSMRLSADLQHLVDKVKILSSRCDNGLENIMSATNVAESKKAIQQSERIENLTALAFIFIPLSFTSSFFGMNFLQLGTGKLPIWTWFIVAIPTLAISVLMASKKIKTAAMIQMRRAYIHIKRDRKRDKTFIEHVELGETV